MINKEKLYEVLRYPLITEKSTTLSDSSKVVFIVSSLADKADIKSSVETLFSVKVKKVNVINQNGKAKVFKGKSGKRNNFKKAIVTLEEGQTIDFSAGV